MATILVIDDDASMCTLLQEALTLAGHEVDVAPHGNAGLALFRQQPRDLVITDLIMPEKEGIETIMELRRDFPDVRIIAMSGGGRWDAEGYLKIAMGAGAQRVVRKPIDLADLKRIVQQLTENAPLPNGAC